MTHQETLTKAIEKAIAGGWLGGGYEPEIVINNDDYDGYSVHIMVFELPSNRGLQSHIFASEEEIIFNQEFAKSLWGERVVDNKCVCGHSGQHNLTLSTPHAQIVVNSGWRYHLQQMVIANDPINYLGDNI